MQSAFTHQHTPFQSANSRWVITVLRLQPNEEDRAECNKKKYEKEKKNNE
jgi:hypothetical protein